MLSYSLKIIIVMHTATLTYGRNCESAHQIENPTNLALNNPHERPVPEHQDSQANHKPDPPKPRNRCCPYDFDSNMCQVVNDRLLCGYNRNVGRPASKDRTFRLSGGCRLRGGRLECGYEHGPFTNLRRPPGWDEVHIEKNDDNAVDEAPNSNVVDNPPQDNNTLVVIDQPPVQTNSYEDDKMALLKLDIFSSHVTPKFYLSNRVTRCVEINDRVVCKPIK